MQRILAAVLVLMFVGVEYWGWFSIETVSHYAIYYFEMAWVALTWVLLRKFQFWNRLRGTQKMLVGLLLPMGWLVFFLAKYFDLPVPFDFNEAETIWFLLLLGPVIEELVFRGAFWRIFETRFRQPLVLIVLTSLFFSYSHYQVIDLLPENVQPYIQYQAGYTLILGLFCGQLRARSGIFAAIIGHMMFNFGFWLGLWI